MGVGFVSRLFVSAQERCSFCVHALPTGAKICGVFAMSKRIVLFADGTGNAFSRRKSNIWRLFDALDTSQKDQIALYIEGVGTSSLRPWAIFDGATGIGAPGNIRKLYQFLCWNWQKGDEIYMFGFSRGAFTIRVLIELMRTEGLVPRIINGRLISHAEMDRNVMAAWRAYRDKSAKLNIWAMFFRPKRFVALIKGFYDIWMPKGASTKRDTIVKATCSQKSSGEHIEIKFVGLFDTVEAFGVPLEALRKAIDMLIWPISFRIEQMSPWVWRVRHALSLDDERTTFQPVRIAKVTRPSITENLLAYEPIKKLLAKVYGTGHRLTPGKPSRPTMKIKNVLKKYGSPGLTPMSEAVTLTISSLASHLCGCSMKSRRWKRNGRKKPARKWKRRGLGCVSVLG
jgi:uncharacterized protein (DUF2235 family)